MLPKLLLNHTDINPQHSSPDPHEQTHIVHSSMVPYLNTSLVTSSTYTTTSLFLVTVHDPQTISCYCNVREMLTIFEVPFC